MGLSSNIIWHQTKVSIIEEILSTMEFKCSYSMETIRWRRSELKVAFPMISFCDLPLSDMSEYLKHNKTDELTGKYGDCTIGLSYEWANRGGLNQVWYHNSGSQYLSETLPRRSILLKTLKSTRFMNRWEILSRIKPFMGELESHGFTNYRFYDEKEVRYVPSRKDIIEAGISPILDSSEYRQYKKSRRPFSKDKQNGDALIPQLSLPFRVSDISYILIANESDRTRIINWIRGNMEHIVFLSYKKVVEEIIGTHHFAKE